MNREESTEPELTTSGLNLVGGRLGSRQVGGMGW